MTCGSPPEVDNSDVVGTGWNYTDEQTYTCHAGARDQLDRFRHVDGSISKTIVCQQNGEWSTDQLSCERKRQNSVYFLELEAVLHAHVHSLHIMSTVSWSVDGL